MHVTSTVTRYGAALIAAVTVSLAVGPTAAVAAPPSSQGGSDGVLYMTEKTDGAIYLGDIQNPVAEKTTFWQLDDSYVDEVSVTETRIGWASISGSSTILGKVLITDIDLTAGTTVEVEVPGTGGIRALGASIQDETFYAIRNDTIYVIPSEGGTPVAALTNASLQAVEWGLWVDGYNQRVYWCSSSNLYGSDMNPDGTLTNFTTIFSGTNPNCDGLGIDPVTQVLYMASYNNPPRFSWANANGSGSVTEIVATDVPPGGAPSSMFVSHDTGKIFLALENQVYEMNFDGTGVRPLYTGVHGSSGFQNLAVSYGRTLDDIDGTDGDGEEPGGGDSDGGNTDGGESVRALADTGFDSVGGIIAASALLLSGVALIVARAKRRTT